MRLLDPAFAFLTNSMLFCTTVFLDMMILARAGGARRLARDALRGLLFGTAAVFAARLPFPSPGGLPLDGRLTLACFAGLAGLVPGLLATAIAGACGYCLDRAGWLAGSAAIALGAVVGSIARTAFKQELDGLGARAAALVGILLSASGLACAFLPGGGLASRGFLPEAAFALAVPSFAGVVVNTVILGLLFGVRRKRDDFASAFRGAMAELRRTESHLRHAIKMARLGSWEYDIAADRFTFNDDFYAIFRTSAEAVGGYSMSSEEYARRFVHPADAHLVAMETRKAMESADPDYASHVEHRMLRADGSEGIIAVRIFLERDEEGRVVRTFGVNQDVTERRRAEEGMRRSLAEKEALLHELYHRTKNNMSVIIALLNMQAKESGDENVVSALAEAQDRIYAMALAHQKLYDSGEVSRVDLGKYIRDLGAYLLSSCAPSPGLVDLEYDLDGVTVGIGTAVPCGLILNELLANAIRHAFPGGRRGTVATTLRRAAGGRVLIRVEDDGVGLGSSGPIEDRMSVGLRIVKSLGESQLKDGRVSFSAGRGFACEIEFADEP